MNLSNYIAAVVLMLFFIFLSGCMQDNDFSPYGLDEVDIQGLESFGPKDLKQDLLLVSGDWGECAGVFWNEKYVDMDYPLQLNILNCRFKDSSTAKLRFDEISGEDFNSVGSCKKISSNFGDSSLQLNCILNNTEINENLLLVLDGTQRYTINITNGGPTAEGDVRKAYELFEAKGKGLGMFELNNLGVKPIDTLYEIIDIFKKSKETGVLVAKGALYWTD